MIAGSPVMASVRGMDNSYTLLEDFEYSDLFDCDWNQGSGLGDRSISYLDGIDFRELEGRDSPVFPDLFIPNSPGDNLLGEETGFQYMLNSLGITNFEWDDESVSSSQTTSSDSMEFEVIDVCDDSRQNSPEPEFKHWRCLLNGNCRWAHLTSSEQASVILELTNLIVELSPRERVEVMKLLNPNVKISHLNPETLVDPSWINDKKIKLIQNYLKSHRTSLSLLVSSESSHKTGQRRTKKKSQKRKTTLKAEDLVEKKVEQAMKEKESGFFKKEIVVSLSPHEATDEDIDIDIIG